MTHLTKIVFFKKPFNEFSCTSWPLSLCKISTKSLKWIQSYNDVPFSYQNGTFAPNKNFLKKTINKVPCTSWPLSLYKISKISLEHIQNYKDAPFLGPKWPILPERIFFQKTHSQTLSRSFMSITCSESYVSLLTRYWRLKNTEIWNPRAFLDIPWESDFFHIYGFHRMLMGHKYFHSTPFPDKTNE